MAVIEASALTTEALEGCDRMMLEATLKFRDFASLAIAVWSEVLREFDERDRVKLASDSYDAGGNALITRIYE